MDEVLKMDKDNKKDKDNQKVKMIQDKEGDQNVERTE